MKILDAPDLQDDFYYNVIDWNQRNELLVALGNVLYVWNAETGEADSVYQTPEGDFITSVKWNQTADVLSCGNS